MVRGGERSRDGSGGKTDKTKKTVGEAQKKSSSGQARELRRERERRVGLKAASLSALIPADFGNP